MEHNLNRLTTGSLGMGSAIVGDPFYYEHVRNIAVRAPEHDYGCLTTFLAVAVTIGREHNVAFIAECKLPQQPYSCGHRPYQIRTSQCRDWKALARLDGFKLDGFDADHSSLGTVMAFSPYGTRVALSDWAQLRVWALDPDTLKEENQELYFPTADFCQENDTGILRYVELPAQGVIHSMCWHDEDILYAMTDRGLVRWDVAPMACGRAEALSSDFES